MENLKPASKRIQTGAMGSAMAVLVMLASSPSPGPTGSASLWQGVASRWLGNTKLAKVRLGTPGTGGTGWQAQALARSVPKRGASHTDSGYHTISSML
jgi:hypothetical protein